MSHDQACLKPRARVKLKKPDLLSYSEDQKRKKEFFFYFLFWPAERVLFI